MSRSVKGYLGAGLFVALVGCSEVTPNSAERSSYRYEGPVTTAVTLFETPAGVIGRAEFTVPAGTTLHAYSETEFSNGEHEAFFSLGDVSTGIPDLTGPTSETLELGPLPPGSRPCYEVGFTASSGDEVPELLELNGCVRVSGS